MPVIEDMQALQAKLAELVSNKDETERNLALLPYRKETEQLRGVMTDLLGRMEQMQAHLNRLMEIGEENHYIEGETQNGDQSEDKS